MTEVSDDFTLTERARVTEWSHYPLPPDLPGRFKPTYNHVGQYTLLHPTTGRQAAFTRATTVAGVLDDTYNLDRWIQRKLIHAVLEGVRLQMAQQQVNAPQLSEKELDVVTGMNHLWAANPNTQKYNQAIEKVDNLTGGRDASEFGTAVHAWLEALDCMIVRPSQVPEMFRAHCEAYRDLLRRHALFPEPQYTERIVFNDQNGFSIPSPSADGVSDRILCPGESITGTLDRIFRVLTSGVLVLGDVKTSKADSLEWGALEFAIQLCIYRLARLMLKLDGSGWEEMPKLYGSTAYLMHIPSDDPTRAACVALNMEFGYESLKVAIYVRDLRRRAKREALAGTIPIPSPEALQWAEARHAIQDVQNPAELAEIWNAHQSVWTDELTAMGQQIAGLF